MNEGYFLTISIKPNLKLRSLVNYSETHKVVEEMVDGMGGGHKEGRGGGGGRKDGRRGGGDSEDVGVGEGRGGRGEL